MKRSERVGCGPALGVILALSCGVPALGVNPVGCEVEKVLAADADALDGFGNHLCARGDVAIAGAWNDEDHVGTVSGFSFGSAYVLRRVEGAWTQEQKLLPSDPASELKFGWDVAISGDHAIVGAPGSNGNTGAVYFYRHDGNAWAGEQKITPTKALPTDEVGFVVAIDGDVAIAGAPDDDTGASDAGAAYIFRNVAGTWVEEQKIIAGDANIFAYFGRAVAIRGDTALITSRVDDDQAVSAGSVYVYRFLDGTWQEVQELYASDASFGDLFGETVAMGDGVAVIGAKHDDDACPLDDLCNSGSAYVFRFDGAQWIEEDKVVAFDGEADDEFGSDVAIDGNIVVVGTQFADDACPEDPECNSGAAYVFQFDGKRWNDKGKLRASDTAWLDFFGASVAVSGGEALVSCHLDDDAGTASGSIYVFDAAVVGCPCPEDLDESGGVGFGDLTQMLSAWGACPAPCAEDLDGDGDVGFADLTQLLAVWGPC